MTLTEPQFNAILEEMFTQPQEPARIVWQKSRTGGLTHFINQLNQRKEMTTRTYTQEGLVTAVNEHLPYPHLITGIDRTEDRAVRVVWRNKRYRVSDKLGVEEYTGGSMAVSNSALLMEALLLRGESEEERAEPKNHEEAEKASPEYYARKNLLDRIRHAHSDDALLTLTEALRIFEESQRYRAEHVEKVDYSNGSERMKEEYIKTVSSKENELNNSQEPTTPGTQPEPRRWRPLHLQILLHFFYTNAHFPYANVASKSAYLLHLQDLITEELLERASSTVPDHQNIFEATRAGKLLVEKLLRVPLDSSTGTNHPASSVEPDVYG